MTLRQPNILHLVEETNEPKRRFMAGRRFACLCSCLRLTWVVLAVVAIAVGVGDSRAVAQMDMAGHDMGTVVPSVPTASKAQMCHVPPPSPKQRKPAEQILTGYGDGGFIITTGNPEAQRYFDNGMQLAHAFAHGSAISAFKRAEILDPSCAMCVWGEAWARGPSINFNISPDAQKSLAELTDHAAALSSTSSETEQSLIAALQKRYKNGGGNGQGDLDYALAMDAIATVHPTDNELAILAADAWMIPASLGNTTDHLARAIQILELGLKRAPDNTGLIHFYMHATEMDGSAREALPFAERLQALAPAASHLVHMPSHTYFAVGRYQDAERSNLEAVSIDTANARRLKPEGGVFGLNYHSHSVSFGEAATLIDGDASAGLALAATQFGETPTVSEEFPLSEAFIVYGRYGLPAQVASLQDPGSALPYAQAILHYARAEAAARQGDINGVKTEASKVALSPAQKVVIQARFAEGIALVDIAHLVVMGRAAALEGRWNDAEVAFRDAASEQETKLGTMTDPPGWWYPVRRSVAVAMLAEGDAANALIEVELALSHFHDDPLSLKVLSDINAKLGKRSEAMNSLVLARKNWSGDIDKLSPMTF